MKLIPGTLPTVGTAMRALFLTGTLLQDLAGVRPGALESAEIFWEFVKIIEFFIISK